MKFIKKLYGYGKSIAKHIWDNNKGNLAKLALTKGIKILKKKVPKKYQEIAEPAIDKLEEYGSQFIENKFGPDLLRGHNHIEPYGVPNIKPNSRLFK